MLLTFEPGSCRTLHQARPDGPVRVYKETFDEQDPHSADSGDGPGCRCHAKRRGSRSVLLLSALLQVGGLAPAVAGTSAPPASAPTNHLTSERAPRAILEP